MQTWREKSQSKDMKSTSLIVAPEEEFKAGFKDIEIDSLLML